MSSKQNLVIEKKPTIYRRAQVFLPSLTDEYESWKPAKGITRQPKNHWEQTALNQYI